MSRYLHGVDVLGAKDASVAATGDKGILIQVKNVPEVVKAQGGAAGGVAYSLAPASITGKVYDTMKDQLTTKLKEQGVDADVKVVVPTGFQEAGSNPIWKPVALGLSGIGVLALSWKLIKRGR